MSEQAAPSPVRVESVPAELGSPTDAAPLSNRNTWHVAGTRGDAVLKLAAPDGTAPPNPRYWAREVKVYDSGLAHTVYAAQGLTAPDVLSTDARGDGSVALWLDFVRGRAGRTWDLSHWTDLATRLGAAQADTPSYGPGWLFRTPSPVGPLAERAAQLRRVLCHLDLRPDHLIARDDDVVLLDWSHAGYGFAGEDLSGVILAHAAQPELLSALDTAMPDAYARGAGVSVADVRIAIAATAPAKYGYHADDATRRVLRMWIEDAPAY